MTGDGCGTNLKEDVKDKTIERCFLILGLEPTATEEEAREARNFATQAFHPDKYVPGSKEQARAHQKQIEINEAYAKLRAWFRQNEKSADRAKSGRAKNGGANSVPTGGVKSGGKSGGAREGTTSSAKSGQQLHLFLNRRARQLIVSAIKLILIVILAFQWGSTITAWWVENHQTGHLPSPSSSAQLVSDRTGSPQTTANDEKSGLLLLMLVLYTLALTWLIFAPESKILIERWTSSGES